MRIFFYAFANSVIVFKRIIEYSKKHDNNIEWGAIYPRGVYRDYLDDLIKERNRFYLFEEFNSVYTEIEHSNLDLDDRFWNDNIYSIIESSKFGYKKHSPNKQLKVFKTIYYLYKRFLIDSKPDYLIFPDIETVNGMILLNICKELGIETMVTTSTRHLGGTFFSKDYRETLPDYYGNLEEEDINKANEFLKGEIGHTIIGNRISKNKSIILKPYANIFIRALMALKRSINEEKNGIFDTDIYLRLRMNFEKYFELWRNFYYEFYQIRYFKIVNCKYKTMDNIEKKYILFLLQVTPESSINTYSQFFIEQERAIELLRLNMPSNHLLYIKEHPAMRGMRSSSWYKRLSVKPGVILVDHKVDTFDLIKKSSLVSTITGSAGFEAYVLNKPVLMFGKTFFSDMVTQYDCIETLRETLYFLTDSYSHDSNNKKIKKIAKIYNISFDFRMHDPFQFPEILEEKNIKNFYHAIIKHISRLKIGD